MKLPLRMGLSLTVGLLSDLDEQDQEGAEEIKAHFEALNDYLRSLRLPTHSEPSTCAEWSADMFGYSGLHTLRRLAAHLDAGRPLPSPGDRDSSQDPLLEAYFLEAIKRPQGLLKKLFGSRPKFEHRYDHLIVHSDAEGYYLPIDFPKVLLLPDRYAVPGQMVGSTPRLMEELTRLAKALQIPADLHSQSDALWEAADNPNQGTELWQRYGIESFSCVVLLEGCRASMAAGAALAFC